MGDQQDITQRLAEIRGAYETAVRRADYTISRSSVKYALDHIDTLTAKLAEAEAERDALRIRLEDCTVALAQTGAGSIVIDDPDEEGQ
jgi:hypothetical protein